VKQIQTVTIVGSNGAMGSGVAGIAAAFGGAKIFMLARTMEKAEESIVTAVKSVRADSIKARMFAKTFDDLEDCVSRSDWVFETIVEDLELKLAINRKIAKYCTGKTIISTGTSGLSIKKLSEAFPPELRKNYFGTHFYNPPYKMILCELIASEYSDKELCLELKEYLKKTLLREVVVTEDLPAFAGNRVGFQFMNEALLRAQIEMKRGGIDYIDSLLGSFTGRALPPLMTVDFVGLDIHKAIVNNVYENASDFLKETFSMPRYVDELIKGKRLGMKSGEGLYKKTITAEGKKTFVYDISADDYRLTKTYDFDFVKHMKDLLRAAEYKKAYDVLLNSPGYEASIIKHFILRYVSYSLMMVGVVVEAKEDMDIVMMTGYNWAPPSVFVDLFGGKNKTIRLMEEYDVRVPDVLSEYCGSGNFYTLQNRFDYRRYFRSR